MDHPFKISGEVFQACLPEQNSSVAVCRKVIDLIPAEVRLAELAHEGVAIHRGYSEPNELVTCQLWLESERGWGTRPDGYSLHLSQQDREMFIQRHQDGMPDTAPEVYSRPRGGPYNAEVDGQTYTKLQIAATACGLWMQGGPPPAA